MSRRSGPGGEGPGGARSGERSEPGRAEPGTSPPQGDKGTRRRFQATDKARLLDELDRSGLTVQEFAEQHGLSPSLLYTWRKLWKKGALGGPGGPRKVAPPARAKAVHSFTPDQRRQAVEAYLKAGMPVKAFAKLYGIADKSLTEWLRRYRQEGPKALEDKKRGRPKGSGGGLGRLPEATKRAITGLKSRFPDFGLRKIRDFLHRFQAVKVSAGGVRNTLKEAGIPLLPAGGRRPKKPEVKRFNWPNPMDLWQTDITSMVLTRHHQRVYLVVFMDDCSRYVVSFALHTHQKAAVVHECLLDGIARFGKPKAVLTDQGPQYFAWRGKSAFQKLLVREGIEHSRARTHHPQTVGKCERFWETVNAEFWDRCHPQDLVEARLRLNHFIAHYNHFRPHQGIDGLVPADRFFGAESALRKTIEAQLAKNEINQALDPVPRKSVYLFGQVDGQQVSLHGEGGRIVIQTSEGDRRELKLEDLGVGQAKGKEPKDDEHDDGGDGAGAKRDDGGGPGDGGGAEAAHAAVPEADEVPARAKDGVPGQGAVGRGEPGGAGAGAPDVHGAARDVAREGDEGAGDGAAESAGAKALAAVAAGPGGYGGGTAPPAEEAGAERGTDDVEPRQRSEDAPQEERGAREGARRDEGRARAPAGAAREPGESCRESDSNEGPRDEHAESGDLVSAGGSAVGGASSERAGSGSDQNIAEGTPRPTEGGSGSSSKRDESRPVAGPSSQGGLE
jgi:transposase-like protein/transposase InsO family protein